MTRTESRIKKLHIQLDLYYMLNFAFKSIGKSQKDRFLGDSETRTSSYIYINKNTFWVNSVCNYMQCIFGLNISLKQ